MKHILVSMHTIVFMRNNPSPPNLIPLGVVSSISCTTCW